MGNLGYWQVGGSTQVEHEIIMLAPPIQYHKGHIWTNVQVPTDNWSLELDFVISESNGGGGFVIWVVDKYGADGPIYGGPSGFLGVGIHARVTQADDESFKLQFRILQNSNALKPPFLKFLPSPLGSFDCRLGQRFIVRVTFTRDTVGITADKQFIGEAALQGDLSDNYIGITAATEDRVSRIDLVMAQFLVQSPLGQHSAPLWEHKPLRNFQPAERAPLRRPYFNRTLVEYEAARAANGEVSSDAPAGTLFDVIDEVNAANFEVASFSELMNFVNDHLAVYGDKWQRRTLKIVERVQHARNVSTAAWNYTNLVMRTFNATLKSSLIKTVGKIELLGETVNESVAHGNGVDEGHAIQYLGESVNESPTIRVLMMLAVIELVALILFLLVTNIPSVRETLLKT
jgi:hypothetical protein